MSNPYLDYVEEKDPRDTYEVAMYYGDYKELGITFLFRTPPNKKYWDRLIIPEIKRIAAENSQEVDIGLDDDGNLREIEIKPPKG